MFIPIPDIYQEAGFIFQVEIGYINCSENNIFFSLAEDNTSAIPFRCTIHDEFYIAIIKLLTSGGERFCPW